MYRVDIVALYKGRLTSFQYRDMWSFEHALQTVRDVRMFTDKLYRVRITESSLRFQKDKIIGAGEKAKGP